MEALMALGKRLDKKAGLGKDREVVAESLLKVRNKSGEMVALKANPAQKEFELKCGPKNIVLKARQMGISTWVAARFFLSTITRPGTLTVQVAHTQEAAEEIFRMVHRFVENLPRDLEGGALRRSKSNRRQLVFPRLDREWERAPETGYVRHFFPWWMDTGYRTGGAAAAELLLPQQANSGLAGDPVEAATS